MKKLATALAAAVGTKEDVVPPAYSCDKEKIVFLGISAAKAEENAFARFCDALNPTKALNVALFVDGKEEAAKKIVARIEQAGAKVCADIHYCNFKFLAGVKQEDLDRIVKWGESIINSLQ